MRSAFGVVHTISKDELGARREQKRKARASAFFERPDIKESLDLTFRPPISRRFNEDVGGAASIRYLRPDGTTTNPKPKAAPSPPAVRPGGSKLKTAALGVAAAGATAGAVHLNRKQTRAARRKKGR